jgi:hypothetical protein
MLIIFQTVSPLCKTFVLLKQGTMAQGFFAVRLLDHLKCFASGSAEFLAEFNVFPSLKLQHSQFPLLADNYPSKQ